MDGDNITKLPSKNDQLIVYENQKIQEAIRLKAYELYLRRNGDHINDIEDWITAERMVLKGIDELKNIRHNLYLKN